MTLGDRVVVMRDGRIQQIGTPLEVYNKPANKFVAGFIGAPAMNFIGVAIRGEGEQLAVEATGMRLLMNGANAGGLGGWVGKRAVMGFRPEHLAIGGSTPDRTFDARVEVVEQLGSEILLETRVGETPVAVARIDPEMPINAGDLIRLSVQPGRLHFFDPESEAPIV
jgi:multiple sugar transport system ATP-binding protein